MTRWSRVPGQRYGGSVRDWILVPATVLAASLPFSGTGAAQEASGEAARATGADSACASPGDEAAPTSEADRYFDSDGVCLRYRVAGEGPPVVLVHGFTVSLDLNWGAVNGVFDTLAEDFRVVAFDNRGHGKSDKPHDPDAYGAEMARDVLRLLDHLEIERAHVVGYSMGAAITVKLLELAPDRLRSAVLGGSGWTPPGENANRELLREWDEGLARVAGEGGSVTDVIWREDWPEALPETRRSLDANDPRALLAVLRSLPGLAAPEAVIRESETPTLLIGGEEDVAFRAAVEAMRGTKPNLTVRIVPGHDHVSLLEVPEFGRMLRDYLVSSAYPESTTGLSLPSTLGPGRRR